MIVRWKNQLLKHVQYHEIDTRKKQRRARLGRGKLQASENATGEFQNLAPVRHTSPFLSNSAK